MSALGTVVLDELVLPIIGVTLAGGAVVIRCAGVASHDVEVGRVVMAVFGPDGQEVAAFPNGFTLDRGTRIKAGSTVQMDLPMTFREVNGWHRHASTSDG